MRMDILIDIVFYLLLFGLTALSLFGIFAYLRYSKPKRLTDFFGTYKPFKRIYVCQRITKKGRKELKEEKAKIKAPNNFMKNYKLYKNFYLSKILEAKDALDADVVYFSKTHLVKEFYKAEKRGEIKIKGCKKKLFKRNIFWEVVFFQELIDTLMLIGNEGFKFWRRFYIISFTVIKKP